ncbi:hypothetical protein ABPG74_003160 [Tetrahymena malaccensis]
MLELIMDEIIQQVEIQYPTIPQMLALVNSTLSLLMMLGFIGRRFSWSKIKNDLFLMLLQNIYQEQYLQIIQSSKLIEQKDDDVFIQLNQYQQNDEIFSQSKLKNDQSDIFQDQFNENQNKQQIVFPNIDFKSKQVLDQLKSQQCDKYQNKEQLNTGQLLTNRQMEEQCQEQITLQNTSLEKKIVKELEQNNQNLSYKTKSSFIQEQFAQAQSNYKLIKSQADERQVKNQNTSGFSAKKANDPKNIQLNQYDKQLKNLQKLKASIKHQTIMDTLKNKSNYFQEQYKILQSENLQFEQIAQFVQRCKQNNTLSEIDKRLFSSIQQGKEDSNQESMQLQKQQQQQNQVDVNSSKQQNSEPEFLQEQLDENQSYNKQIIFPSFEFRVKQSLNQQSKQQEQKSEDMEQINTGLTPTNKQIEKLSKQQNILKNTSIDKKIIKNIDSSILNQNCQMQNSFLKQKLVQDQSNYQLVKMSLAEKQKGQVANDDIANNKRSQNYFQEQYNILGSESLQLQMLLEQNTDSNNKLNQQQQIQQKEEIQNQINLNELKYKDQESDIFPDQLEENQIQNKQIIFPSIEFRSKQVLDLQNQQQQLKQENKEHLNTGQLLQINKQREELCQENFILHNTSLDRKVTKNLVCIEKQNLKMKNSFLQQKLAKDQSNYQLIKSLEQIQINNIIEQDFQKKQETKALNAGLNQIKTYNYFQEQYNILESESLQFEKIEQFIQRCQQSDTLTEIDQRLLSSICI